ncbi:MAG: class I SAM-dependent methyltransferase [Chloroflexi bacterium]|uniref:class I SAM-dependent methyltransferase n=1 Tax=Candidatus Flexifilum breve TaxID=3140694 RepID=UPI00313646C9|nr:class I SAM-dependent methyltransferase [Chloroflexota bacterium]
MEQVDALIAALNLQPGDQVLELGCGNGMVAEYIAEQTGTHITGVDYSPQGVDQAQRRTAGKREHLTFAVGDLNTLELPAATYDAIISIVRFISVTTTRAPSGDGGRHCVPVGS